MCAAEAKRNSLAVSLVAGYDSYNFPDTALEG
jgi:hypothetical protein